MRKSALASAWAAVVAAVLAGVAIVGAPEPTPAAPRPLNERNLRDIEQLLASAARDADAGRESTAASRPTVQPADESERRRTGIVGRVVDAETAAPIAGALVEVWPALGMSRSPRPTKAEGDATTGTFEVGGLLPGPYRLVVAAPGHVDAAVARVVVRDGEITPEVVVRMTRAATIRGRVVEAVTGEPIPGVELSPSRPYPKPFFGRTRDDGTFEMKTGLSDPLTLIVRSQRHVVVETSEIEPVIGQSVEVPTLALRSGGAIEGSALDERGRPMKAWASCQRENEPLGDLTTKSGQIGADGLFAIRGVAAGPWKVIVGDESGYRMTGHVRVNEGETVRVVLRMIGGGKCTVSGRITRGGEPIAGARVAIRIAEVRQEIGDRQATVQTGRTARDGRFSIAGVVVGSGAIEIEEPKAFDPEASLDPGAFERRTEVPVEIPDATTHVLDIAIPAGGTIAGRVTRASDSAPVVGMDVNIELDDESPFRTFGSSAKTDAKGAFSVSSVSAGRYRLSVRDAHSDTPQPHLAAPPRFAEVRDGETKTVDFSVSPGAEVVVELRAPDGSPVRDRAVRLTSPIDENEAFAPTDRKGIARFSGVAEGRYVASVVARGDACGASVGPFDVAVGNENRHVLAIAPGVDVRVDVRGSAPGAVEWWLAEARDSRGVRISGGLRSDDGTATMRLSPGRYTIRVEGSRTGSATVEVGSAPTGVRVDLDPAREKR